MPSSQKKRELKKRLLNFKILLLEILLKLTLMQGDLEKKVSQTQLDRPKIRAKTRFINKTEKIELIKSTGEKDINRISHGISFRHGKQ